MAVSEAPAEARTKSRRRMSPITSDSPPRRFVARRAQAIARPKADDNAHIAGVIRRLWQSLGPLSDIRGKPVGHTARSSPTPGIQSALPSRRAGLHLLCADGLLPRR